MNFLHYPSRAIQLVRTHAAVAVVLGGALFAASAGLVAAHVIAIAAMRDVGFPVAADVESLQRRKVVIAEQAEIAELHASARGETYRELFDLYVLPDQPDMPRTLAVLERLLTHLQRQGIVRTIDSMTTGTEETAETVIELRVSVAPGKASELLDLLDLSGVLTVSDAFTHEEREALLVLTERENPAVIAALEQFLSGDLLQYAIAPQYAESQLLKSVVSESFESDFRALLDVSRLRAFAQTALLLNGRSETLWPLPLFTTEASHWEDMGHAEQLTLTLRAHSKGD